MPNSNYTYFLLAVKLISDKMGAKEVNVRGLMKIKIAIGNDHTAVQLKNTIKSHLENRGFDTVDLGTDSSESFDYPIAGFCVAKMVADGGADCGILICGTGVGISLAANKVKGIRACVCSEAFSAKLSKQHNNANILCFGARVVGDEVAKMIVDAWLDAEFEGGRHGKRVDMIMKIEKKQELDFD